ncbi:hypothetical protein PFBG_04122 [Plasmodium falciparum 7G8]|uniref:Erythrocyte membrane protein 1, PfEMP1 n=1 Tax=Plasmodium falciparum (isolate 7G8) TaxID=57266 RepID=W7FBR0_PLAF8|nr:hypothetical protein PFBG_04122 [Plasmodium falciparum 7G8]
MVSQKPTAEDYGKATSAKEFLDLIGETVQEKVHDAAKKYVSELKGDLSRATYPKDEHHTDSTSSNPCHLDYRYHTNVTDGHGKEHPCKDRPEVRFSDTEGAQCDKSKIKDNKGKSEGACAPYRRSSLCDHHLSYMNAGKTNTTDNLLLEVCLAAKFEGASIKGYHPQHKRTNPDSQLCTELARSFADIGDIVRGKDLFLGNSVESAQRIILEKNLKGVFGNIYNELTTSGKNVDKAKERYKGDADNNYFQLREDWWEENRETVWKAITCDVHGSDYFRHTCSAGKYRTATNHDCRCINFSVPTYFDYVPQYLRWLHEWAEDFCRKKKKYVNIVKKFCREGENGKDKYCSGDGFDCTKTIRAKYIYAIGDECTKCSFWCGFYKKWLANQKQEFLKQKKKYETEISGSSRKKRSTSNNNYKGYDEEFYNILKSKNVGGLDKFLELLKEQSECKRFSTDEGTIDFTKHDNKNNDQKGTFYYSKYCEICPECGVEKKSNGEFQEKTKNESGECKGGKRYEIPIGTHHNVIPVLSFGDKRDEIKSKIHTFCNQTSGSSGGGSGDCGGNSDSSLCEPWKCYKEDDIEKHFEDDLEYDKEVKGAGGLCILEKTNGKEKVNKQKTFNDFFYFWVGRLLNDSIEWREKLGKCLKNGTKILCKNGCKTPCKCYESWVEQKKTEWGKIVQHFNTQDGFGDFGHYFVLETVLEDSFLEDITKAYGDARAIQGIKKTLAKKKKERDADTSNQKTIIDYLLDHEKEDAKKCVTDNPDKCEDTGGSRSQTPHSPAAPTAGPVEPDSDDDADEEAEEEKQEEQPEEVEETAEDHTEEPQEPPQQEASPTPAPAGPDVCKIVGGILTKDNLEAACKLKYDGKYYGWKCIPTSGGEKATDSESERPTRQRREASGDTTGSDKDGAICIPPRRRKLYIGKIKEWANNSGNDTQVSGGNTDALRDAFIQSAAIETFFLWDRYKKLNTKGKGSQDGGLPQVLPVDAPVLPFRGTPGPSGFNVRAGGLGASPIALELPDGAGGSEETPETSLKSGTIPNDFLRLMFYTLGDYRDILVRGGGDVNSGNDVTSRSNDNKNIVFEAGGTDEKDKQEMEKIQQEIDKILKQGENKESASGGPISLSVNQTQSSDKRTNWWKTNGEHIWNGMICALTYRDSEQKGEPPEVDESLKSALWDDTNNKPKNDYQYSSVTIGGEGAEGQLQSTDSKDAARGEKTPLDSFIKRPPYFRYLEEWGQNFCKERKKRLEKIKGDCKVEENNGRRGELKQKYSGDGEDCDRRNTTNGVFADLEGQSCADSCKSYKKWIDIKKIQYEKQEKIYSKQKTDAKNNNGFYTKLEKNWTTATAFLQNLGSCKKDNGNEIGEGKKIFDDKDKTFGPAKNCKPCSEFKIKCKGTDHCDSSKGNGCDSKNSITAKDIETMGTRTDDVSMLVSDNGESGFGDGLQDSCGGAGIFKGIKENKWKCGNVCGLDVCGLKSDNGKNYDQIILIRAFIERWLENFLEDYNKIRHKISHRMNNGEGCKCINGCIEKWVEQKKEEWKKIKEHYQKQYGGNDSGESYPVKTILEKFEHRPEFNKAIKPCNDLKSFEKSCGLNGDDSSQKKKGEERDLVVCFLEKLEKKIEQCKKKHDKNSVETSDQPDKQCQESPPLPEDYEEENPVTQHPSFCNIEKKAEPMEEVETCGENDEKKDEQSTDEKPAAPEVPGPTAPSGDETPVLKPEEEAPGPPPPAPADQPFDSTILQTTIPFGVALALGSIAFFFMKKKTKSSVGNLFQILQIPKGDYDIPTKLSPNRYIPYTSGKYRGKRYIYLEGDSGTDSGYTDHYSDITSSSESEYEEMDINDIYVPGSPKYKTLIEVVLEPSGNNTTASGQIHMDNPKTTNEFTYVDSNPNQVDDTYVDSNPDNSSMDTILDDLDKYNEPYYDVQDDIYYDVNDHDTSTADSNAMDVPSKVQIEMDVNTKLVKEKYPIADVWDI